MTSSMYVKHCSSVAIVIHCKMWRFIFPYHTDILPLNFLKQLMCFKILVIALSNYISASHGETYLSPIRMGLVLHGEME